MSSNTVNIRCWEIGGTAQAILVALTPKSRNPTPSAIWLPKSMIEHASRMPPKTGDWREIEITLPEWFAEKKGLI